MHRLVQQLSAVGSYPNSALRYSYSSSYSALWDSYSIRSSNTLAVCWFGRPDIDSSQISVAMDDNTPPVLPYISWPCQDKHLRTNFPAAMGGSVMGRISSSVIRQIDRDESMNGSRISSRPLQTHRPRIWSERSVIPAFPEFIRKRHPRQQKTDPQCRRSESI
jgi:hypothetical protein